MSTLLPALDSPCSKTLDKYNRIDFRHPAYPETEEPLLTLGAFDGKRKDGIDYDVALWACGIVTNNSWPNGWLAFKHQDGYFERVEKPDDGVLRCEVYYYLLSDAPPTYRYPVIPSFDHWRFPHDNLPFLWQHLRIPKCDPVPSVSRSRDLVVSRDRTCRISGHGNATEVAHLVPVANRHWLIHNKMQRYCFDRTMDDPANMILLRKDLHHLFNQRRFAFVARRVQQSYVRVGVHVLMPQNTSELFELYHNRQLHHPHGLSKEFLFARFAWSIFQDSTFPFLQGLAKYDVSLFDASTGESRVHQLFEREIRERASVFPPFTPSHTNSLRRQEEQTNQDFDQDDRIRGYSPSDGISWNESYDEPPRGRRRKRSWDSQGENSLRDPLNSFGSARSPAISSRLGVSPNRNLSSKDELKPPLSKVAKLG